MVGMKNKIETKCESHPLPTRNRPISPSPRAKSGPTGECAYPSCIPLVSTTIPYHDGGQPGQGSRCPDVDAARVVNPSAHFRGSQNFARLPVLSISSKELLGHIGSAQFRSETAGSAGRCEGKILRTYPERRGLFNCATTKNILFNSLL